MIDQRVTRRQYARAVLVGALTAHPRDWVVNVLVAQMYAESGPARCDGVDGARYNPLNTTLDTPFAMQQDFNSVGVRNYMTIADGIAATTRTLLGSNFATVRGAMMADITADDLCQVIAGSLWGTGPLLGKVMVQYRKDPERYDSIRVGPVPS